MQFGLAATAATTAAIWFEHESVCSTRLIGFLWHTLRVHPYDVCVCVCAFVTPKKILSRKSCNILNAELKSASQSHIQSTISMYVCECALLFSSRKAALIVQCSNVHSFSKCARLWPIKNSHFQRTRSCTQHFPSAFRMIFNLSTINKTGKQRLSLAKSFWWMARFFSYCPHNAIHWCVI